MAGAEVVARKAVALRIRGESYPKIAAILDLSVSSAYEAYRRGLNELCPVEDLVEERQRSRLLLDELRAKIWRRLQKPGCELACFDVALRVEARAAALLGLDSATAFDLTVQSRSPNADLRVAQIQKNLTVDQQRQLVALLRLARDGPANGKGDRQASNVSPVTAEPASQVEGTDPAPSHFHSLAEYCAQTGIEIEDPAAEEGLRQAEERWGLWHNRHHTETDCSYCKNSA
jgi:hypothetical protein